MEVFLEVSSLLLKGFSLSCILFVLTLIIALPLGVDPDEFIKEHGKEAFWEKMKTARTSIEYLMDEVNDWSLTQEEKDEFNLE